MPLNLLPNLANPDAIYEALIDTHQGLDTAQSHELNAKLVLILMNHIGEDEVLREALMRARDSVLGPKLAEPQA